MANYSENDIANTKKEINNYLVRLEGKRKDNSETWLKQATTFDTILHGTSVASIGFILTKESSDLSAHIISLTLFGLCLAFIITGQSLSYIANMRVVDWYDKLMNSWRTVLNPDFEWDIDNIRAEYSKNSIIANNPPNKKLKYWIIGLTILSGAMVLIGMVVYIVESGF